MSQNTVDCGRTELQFPEFQFDNSDGGQQLWQTLFNCFERLTNDDTRRTLQITNLAQSETVTLTHGFNQSSSELEVRLWVSGVEQTLAQIDANYSISYPNNNQVELTKTSVGAISGWLSVSAIRASRVNRPLRFEAATEPGNPPVGMLDLFWDGVDIKAKINDGTVVQLTGNAIEAPAGSILAFAGASTPSGWLACDGAAVSRTTYARLFSAIGTIHGQGDGATTFHLPDYRGRFLRGVDGSAGRDPDKTGRTASNSGGNTGNNVGSVQGDETKSHNHTQNSHNHTQDSHNHTQNAHTHTQAPHSHGTPSDFTASGDNGFKYTATANAGWIVGTTTQTPEIYSQTATNQATTATNQAATATNNATGGNETRPLNAYVNYIIKY